MDFPSYKMVIFNSYVKLPEGIAFFGSKHPVTIGDMFFMG